MKRATSWLICVTIIAVNTLAATSSLPRSTPEAEGISSAAILSFVAAAEAKIDALHGFMLVRHGRVAAEGWWQPYSAERTHILNSLTKSFTSTAVGLAIAEGKLRLEDPVLRFFPEHAPEHPDAWLQQMTVRDLLRMATGHAKKDVDRYFNRVPLLPAPDLMSRFFKMPIVNPPGTQFVYDPAGSHMLSMIVQRVTGQTVEDYLRSRLFEPLGIAGVSWERDGKGVSYGAFGLHVHTEDIAKFGQLYLQKGQWEGRQLLPAAWVAEATRKQIDNRKPNDTSSDWAQGYGYQFWMCRHGFYRGDGAFGQFCIVMPQYDAVVAITSGTKDMAGVMTLVWDKIVPAFHDGALPPDEAAAAKLSAKMKSLRLEKNNGLGGF